MLSRVSLTKDLFSTGCCAIRSRHHGSPDRDSRSPFYEDLMKICSESPSMGMKVCRGPLHPVQIPGRGILIYPLGG